METIRNSILYLPYRKSQQSLPTHQSRTDTGSGRYGVSPHAETLYTKVLRLNSRGAPLSFLLLFFLSSVVCLLLSVTALRADTKPTWRNFSSAGKFITAIAWDKNNNLWVAGEEFGVSLIDKRTIKTFDIPYCYTILCDNIGKVWIGSLREGLYCYHYGEWTNFNTSNGLPSNSVHALAVDKYNTLYCASGLSLSKLSEGKWETVSLPDTLPRSEISCMDFDKDNNLWVGFSLGGVAKFNGFDWKVYPVRSSLRRDIPTAFLQKQEVGVTSNGVYTQEDGLGGDGRVNDILVSRDGTVWVATCNGISRVKPETGYWQSFVYSSEPLCTPQQWGYSPANYLLKIAEDNSGNIFFANRHAYILRWGDKDSCLMDFAPKNQLPDSFVYCITTDDDDYIWAGTYGGGITTNNPTFKFPQRVKKLKIELKEKTPPVDFSKELEQKELITKTYKLLKDSTLKEQAYYIGEDWLTRGDWIGNYGEYAWILCGYNHYYEPKEEFLDLVGGSDMLNLYSFKHVKYYPYIGENADPTDMIRSYMIPEWELIEVPQFLQDPLGGGRRQTGWDDHAEAYPYPLIREGPHIYLDLDFIEEGVFIVSFYFMSTYDPSGMNRYRDFTISVKRRTSSEKDFAGRPLLASCRVHDLQAGVYKRFMLKGPGKYTIKFDKKESFDTCFSGVFIDKVEEP